VQVPPLQSTETIVRTILPALKTFPTNEVAIVGCHATGLARRSCEYDLLVINRDPIPEKVVRIEDSYAHIIFRKEAEVRQPEPELSITLATAVPLRDNSLLLASAISDSRLNYRESCNTLLELYLASSLKAVGRVDDLLAAGETREADFWLVSAAYDYAYAELLNFGVVPAPSHLLKQMKTTPRRRGRSFQSWTSAAGLELSSRAACENRLEALSIVYDVLRTSDASLDMLPQLGRYKDAQAFNVLKLKAEELIQSIQSVDCFSYLGREMVRSVVDLYSLHASRLSKAKDYNTTIRDLTIGEDRLISEEVLRSLGLVRSPEMLKDANAALKTAVSVLAKKI
jgi:hypothetical protein